MSSSVLPVFSSKRFIVSGLTFRSLIHFEFIFVYGVRRCSNFILLQVRVCVLSCFSRVWLCDAPGSSVPGILQAKILDWVAVSFSKGSS